MYDAYRTFVERSIKSQNGWANRGPNGHLNSEERTQLANIRWAERQFLLEHPKEPPEKNEDMPF